MFVLMIMIMIVMSQVGTRLNKVRQLYYTVGKKSASFGKLR